MTEHEHDWVKLGNLEVCRETGCNGHRATTPEAEVTLAELGDTTRDPMK